MSLSVTLALFAAFLAVGLFCGWRGARPPNPLRGPRMMPWRFLMMLSAVGVLVMLTHLANLAGMKTGR